MFTTLGRAVRVRRKLRYSLVGLAIMWWGLAAVTLFREPYYYRGISLYFLYGLLMTVNGGVAYLAARFWTGKNALIKWLGYCWISLNIILTITDQVGLIDLVILGLSGVVLILMVGEGRKQKS